MIGKMRQVGPALPATYFFKQKTVKKPSKKP